MKLGDPRSVEQLVGAIQEGQAVFLRSLNVVVRMTGSQLSAAMLTRQFAVQVLNAYAQRPAACGAILNEVSSASHVCSVLHAQL